MTSHELPQRSLAIAGTVGGVEIIAKLIIFYLHDRAWNHVAWGIKDE